MADKEITIIIDDEGNSSVDLVGYQGTACEAIQKVFGSVGKTRKATKKAEFYKRTGNGSVNTCGR